MRAMPTILALMVFLALALGARSAAAQDKLTVSVPQRGAWDTGISDLGQRAGIFKKHGLILDILYTGAGVGSGLGAFAKGAPVRVFSGEMIGSPNQFWYVPASSPIRSIEDLAGKTIGYSVTGSSSHSALLELLRQYHVTAKPTATGGMPSTHHGDTTRHVRVGV